MPELVAEFSSSAYLTDTQLSRFKRIPLQGGLRHAPIPALAQATGADPLGERPFDAGPPLIELLTRLAGRPGLRCCERLVVGPNPTLKL